jgi:sugar transferase (PEP-CTERM/EpsH1 system associated)
MTLGKKDMPDLLIPTQKSSTTRRFADSAGPMRVCHISLGLSTGGLERLLVDFARFHDRTQFEMTFVALHDAARPAAEIRELGCEVIALQGQRLGRVARFRQLASLFRTLAPDVVHTHNAFPHWYASPSARWAGVPVVINTRHGQRFGQTWRGRLQYQLASKFVKRIVAVSDDAAALCRTEDKLPANKVLRIWNGIDPERFKYRGPVQQPVAISVARLSAEKDFPTLLRAFGIARKRIPGLRLRIVGDGAERPGLERLSTELGLTGTVEFLGERSGVPELLAEAGFFVSSSLTEGISLTLLEAMAVGLPVLATAVGGNPEIVVPGETGRLVPAGDPAALANGLVELCHEQQRWPEYGENARRRVVEHFDIRRMIRDYEDLYRVLLAPAP